MIFYLVLYIIDAFLYIHVEATKMKQDIKNTAKKWSVEKMKITYGKEKHTTKRGKRKAVPLVLPLISFKINTSKLKAHTKNRLKKHYTVHKIKYKI